MACQAKFVGVMVGVEGVRISLFLRVLEEGVHKKIDKIGRQVANDGRAVLEDFVPVHDHFIRSLFAKVF